MPALESLDVVGRLEGVVLGLRGRIVCRSICRAPANIRGAASRFETLTLDSSGAGNVDLDDVPVTDADVDVSGAGERQRCDMAGGRLTGDMSGAGNLDYYGTVSEQSVDKSGFVSIRHRD